MFLIIEWVEVMVARKAFLDAYEPECGFQVVLLIGVCMLVLVNEVIVAERRREQINLKERKEVEIKRRKGCPVSGQECQF